MGSKLLYRGAQRQANDKDNTVAAATPQRVRQVEASLIDRMVRTTPPWRRFEQTGLERY